MVAVIFVSVMGVVPVSIGVVSIAMVGSVAMVGVVSIAMVGEVSVAMVGVVFVAIIVQGCWVTWTFSGWHVQLLPVAGSDGISGDRVSHGSQTDVVGVAGRVGIGLAMGSPVKYNIGHYKHIPTTYSL
jgi:hypothetical protein